MPCAIESLESRRLLAATFAPPTFVPSFAEVHSEFGDFFTSPVVLRNKLFYTGGTDASGMTSNVIDIYDSATNRFSTHSLSQEPDVAATVGGKVVFAGGVDPWGYGTFHPSNVANIYDDRTGRWSTSTISAARGAMTTAVVDDQILLAGGLLMGADRVETPSNAVDIYHDSTGAWSSGTLSQARAAISATTIGQQAIFAGGTTVNSRTVTDVIDIYHTDTGHWSTARLSSARSNIVAVSVGHFALFAGGDAFDVTGNYQAKSDVDIYDAYSGTWSTLHLSPIKFPLGGGKVGNNAVFSDGRTVYSFNGRTGRWSNFKLPREIGPTQVTALGAATVFSSRDTIEMYDPASHRWSLTPTGGFVKPIVTAVGGKLVIAEEYLDVPPWFGGSSSVRVFTPANTLPKGAFTGVDRKVIAGFA